jgi:hypothetical protein
MSNIEILLSDEQNGTVTLTAKYGGESLTDRLKIARATAREKFADRVMERWPTVDRTALDRELERVAAEHANRSAAPPEADGPELDLRNIVRPERFIMATVSGFAIPTFASGGDKPVGRWQVYLVWAGGLRERRHLASSIELPGGGKLWIHPTPSEPTPSMVQALGCWSSRARQQWLLAVADPDPADLFQRLSAQIAYFIDLPPERAPGITATLALWVILTYCYPAWDAVPYLFVGGPLGSGKSRVFEILSRLAFRPLSSSSLTGPALFRTLHNQGGTLLLDEAERLKQATPETGEILSMLLAGYKRGGQATRLEPVGDTFKTVSFDVYGCKALACIAGLPPALSSRCIPILMFRAAPDSPKPRRRIDADPAAWQQLRDDLYALALNHGATWLSLAGRQDVCPAMSGRDYELWQPLMALASWIESKGAAGLLNLLQKHALATIDAGREEQTPDTDEILLRILTAELLDGRTPKPSEILNKVQEIESEMFRKWSARGVASHLKRYGLNTYKSHGKKVYGRDALDALRRVQDNYGVDLELREPTPGNVPNVPQRTPTGLFGLKNEAG